MALLDRFEPWHLLLLAAFLVGADGSLWAPRFLAPFVLSMVAMLTASDVTAGYREAQ